MTESASQVEQEVTADTTADQAEVVSDARAARKEAQTLVTNVADQLGTVASAISGRSGLAADEKASLLARAHSAAQALKAEAEKLEAAVKKAVDSL